MKQTFFMSLFLIAAMILSACSKMPSLSSPTGNSSLYSVLRALGVYASWNLAPTAPLWDGTIWNNPLPDYAYPGPVPIHSTYYS